jgi:sRNA-binding regulator protein Hfq
MGIRAWFEDLSIQRRAKNELRKARFPVTELSNGLTLARKWMKPLDRFTVTLEDKKFNKSLVLVLQHSTLCDSLHLAFLGFGDGELQSLNRVLAEMGLSLDERSENYVSEWLPGQQGELQITMALSASLMSLSIIPRETFSATGPSYLDEELWASGYFYGAGECRYGKVDWAAFLGD